MVKIYKNELTRNGGGGGWKGAESAIVANVGPVGNGQGVLVHKVKNKWMKVSIRPHSESVCTGITVEILLYRECPQGIHT